MPTDGQHPLADRASSRSAAAVLSAWVRRAPVDLDPFETNEVDLSGGMAGVLARMTSKGRYNVGLAKRHRVEVEVTTDPAAAARFHPLLVETAARQGFAAEPLCYLMDLSATLFPAGMAAAFFATYRGETLAAAIAVFFGPRATYLYGPAAGNTPK